MNAWRWTMIPRAPLLRRALFLIAFIGLTGPVVIRAWADDDEDRALTAQREARQQREAAECRQRLVRLDLDATQARRLLPIVEQAAQLQIEMYEQQAQFLPELLSAFTAFADEDRLNQGFSKDVERRAAQLSHRESEARDKVNAQLITLEQETAHILTPSQLDSLQAPHGATRLAPAQTKSNGPRRPAADVDRLPALRQELEAIHALKHPRSGPLARCLFHPAAIEPLCQTAGRPPSETLRRALDVAARGTAEYPLEPVERQRAEVGRLRKEINNWNLINGLHLDGRQTDRIVALYDAATPPTARQGKASARPAGTMLASLERAVEDVLNPGQRQVLADYKACLIPPKNLKDPVRVGQASDHSPYEQWLEKARRQTGARLERAIGEVLTREAQHNGALTDPEKQQRATALRVAARKAAALPDSEFELSKAVLAERIAATDRPKELQKELDAIVRSRGQPGRLAQFILNPDFIEQLRQRGEQLAAGVQPRPADLASGPQAENCDKSCALPPKKTPRQK